MQICLGQNILILGLLLVIIGITLLIVQIHRVWMIRYTKLQNKFATYLKKLDEENERLKKKTWQEQIIDV